jgi:hypothetical protein
LLSLLCRCWQGCCNSNELLIILTSIDIQTEML